MAVRVLLVEDEPLMRERLRSLLLEEPDIVLVDECANGLEAVAAIARHHPDLVFLDVQMPGLDGFGVIDQVGVERMPATILVTAYDHYALRAFEVHALDYLLKPFNRKRFQEALHRARARLTEARTTEGSGRLFQLLEAMKSTPRPLQRFVIKAEGRITFLKAADVDWIEAAGNYVRLHVGKEVHLLRETMSVLE